MGVNITTKNTMDPQVSKGLSFICIFVGNKFEIIRQPSNGGNGNKLKTPNTTFSETKMLRNDSNEWFTGRK